VDDRIDLLGEVIFPNNDPHIATSIETALTEALQMMEVYRDLAQLALKQLNERVIQNERLQDRLRDALMMLAAERLRK
jgi:hypothetical protein